MLRFCINGSVGWYSMFCAIFYDFTPIPPIWIVIISFFASVLVWSIPVYFFIRWRRDVGVVLLCYP